MHIPSIEYPLDYIFWIYVGLRNELMEALRNIWKLKFWA